MPEHISRVMLQELLAEVNRESRNYPQAISKTGTNSNTINNQSVSLDVDISEKQILQVKGDTLIAADGTHAKLYNPLPGINWSCTGVADTNGVFTLNTPLTALILTFGDNNYCLGVTGDTEEFEVKINIDEQEITVNQDYINISYERLVEQGVERK